jgi:hypothetical protein
MNAQPCDRIPLEALTDYAAGELPESEAVALEEHLFSCAECAARAAQVEALARAVRSAVGSAAVSGFVTDAVLNRLSRDGIRVRTFVLSPGARVPCAVWEDDEVMALRLRGEFGGARELTLCQRVEGKDVMRATVEVDPRSPGEIIHVAPAEWIRGLPEAEIQLVLSAQQGGEERPIATYTLLHGGTLHRR